MKEILKCKSGKRFLIVRLLAKMAHACYFCLFPIFLYNKGFTVFDISILETIFSIGIVIFEIPTGLIADRMRRDKCIHLSYFLMFSSYLMIFINQSYVILISANILMALSASFSSGIIDVWLIDGLQAEGYNKGMVSVSSFMQIIENVGTTCGLILGGILALLQMKYSFTGGLVLIIIGTVLALILIDNNSINNVMENEKIVEYISNSIRAITTNFLLVSITMAFIGFAIASPLNDHWQVQFHQKGIDNKFILSNIYTIRTVFIILGGIIATRVKKISKMSNLAIFRAFIVISAVALIMSAMAQSWIVSLLFWSIISITNTIARSCWTAELISTMDATRRSTLFSINSLIFSLSSSLGSLVIGKIAEVKSISFGWNICAIVMFIAVVFSIMVSRKLRIKATTDTNISKGSVYNG